jgi:hypothetical protein
LVLLLAALAGCKQAEKKDKSDSGDTTSTVSTVNAPGASTSGVDPNTPTVPQVGAIALERLGTQGAPAALALADTCGQGALGVMGFALGGACNTAPFASRIMIGSRNGDFDGDGDMDCDDFAAAKAASQDPGILLSLLCEKVMQANDNVVSLAFEGGTQEAFAISFKDFQNDVPAVGMWSHGTAASYPADIRIFKGPDLDTLKGTLALSLTDPNNGAVKIAGFGDTGKFSADLAFSNKKQTGKCADAPSTTNCHWQDIRIYGGEASTVGGPPNGFHLKIFAEDKEKPSFIALEGKYRYTAATIADITKGQQGCPGAELAKLRNVYFQTVQRGGQIWGKFTFLDEAGQSLSCDLGGGVDPFALMARADGICQNVGSDRWVPCTEVDYTKYVGLWQGEDAFATVTESPVSEDTWANPPTERGLCTSSGCTQ